MNQGHCSFCDCYPLEDRSGEPIEHFKPKSRPEFHGEAFSWPNLYYACEFCQKTIKVQWDEGLLRPAAPDYAFRRYFEFDYTNGAIRPSLMAVPDDQTRAAVTIRLYGLDSPPRRRMRLEYLKNASAGIDLDHCAYRDFLESGREPSPSPEVPKG